ncbi:hypothetical protein BpHYR1_040404 [Brachionus plicatilis]|uniref:Uncharacterized protein n=1 Tax=Brachionus plicatilis TaxID=10195 RepID=A0A3M7QPK6_BRAPC|nr:hypothetical protein BpHYR1_040404 [Brachionus plicatilis]
MYMLLNIDLCHFVGKLNPFDTVSHRQSAIKKRIQSFNKIKNANLLARYIEFNTTALHFFKT